MMFEKLNAAVDRQADRLLMRTIARLAESDIAPGVEAEALPDGVRLTGRGLRARMVADARLRSFGR